MTDRLIQPWTPEDKREYGRLADEAFRAKEALWHASQRLQDWLAEHPTTEVDGPGGWAVNVHGEDAGANFKIPPTWAVRVTVTAPPHIAAPREIVWRFLHQPSTIEVETMLLHAVRSVARELQVAAVTTP